MNNLGILFFGIGDKVINGGLGTLDGAKVFVFSNFFDLPNDYTWISNLSEEEIEHFGLPSRVKPNDFCSLSLNSIIYEHGFMNSSPEEMVLFLYDVIKDVYLILEESYGPMTLDKDPVALLSDVFFKDEGAKFNEFSDRHSKIIDDCSVTALKSKFPAPEGSSEFYLYYPRYKFVKRLCKATLPFGESKELSISDIKSLTDDVDRWITNISLKYKMFCKVEILDVAPELRMLTAHHYNRSSIWISGEEYMFFSARSDIKLSRVLLFRGTTNLIHFEPKRLFNLNDMDQYSLMGGIAANCYIKSIQSFSPKSVQSIWVDSMDRLMMLKVAFYFYNAKINVTSFGSGGITLSLEDHDIEKAIKIAERVGLMYSPKLLSRYREFIEAEK